MGPGAGVERGCECDGALLQADAHAREDRKKTTAPSRRMRTKGHRLEVGRGCLKSKSRRQGPGPEDWVSKRNGTWRLQVPEP